MIVKNAILYNIWKIHAITKEIISVLFTIDMYLVVHFII